MSRPVPSRAAELAGLPKWRPSPLPLLGRFVSRGRQYARLVFWLLRKAFSGKARTLALVAGLSVLYLAGQAAALYSIYWYGMRIQGDPAAVTYGLEDILPPADDLLLLWLVVVFAASSLILSSIFLYFSRTTIFRVVEKDFRNGLEYIANMCARLPDPRAPLASRLLMEHKRSCLVSGCRRGAVTAIAFSRSTPPMVAGFGAVGLMVLIDSWLTLSIALAGIVWAALLYPITLRAVSFALRREKAQADYRREAELLPPRSLTDQAFAPMESPPELASAYVGRHRVMNEMILITEIGATAIVAFAILYMAGQVMAGTENWAIFIAFIGALRLALAGGFQGVRAFASVSRFYPMIVRYYQFMIDIGKIDQVDLGAVRRSEPIILGACPDGSPAIIRAGDRVALLADSAPLLSIACAFLNVRSADTGVPLGVALVDTNDIMAQTRCANAVAVVEGRKLRQLNKTAEPAVDEAFMDKAVLVVHRDSELVSDFGESHLLALERGVITHFSPLGSAESSCRLQAFAKRTAQHRAASRDDFDEEDEDDEML